MEFRRKQHTKALEHRPRLHLVAEAHGMGSGAPEVRQHLVVQELAQLRAHLLVGLQSGSYREPSLRACAGRHRSLPSTSARNLAFKGGASLLHQIAGLRRQLPAHPVNLLVDRLHRKLRGLEAWHEMLQCCAQNSAHPNEDEQPHEHPGKRTAKMKSTMKKNQWKAEKTK